MLFDMAGWWLENGSHTADEPNALSRELKRLGTLLKDRRVEEYVDMVVLLPVFVQKQRFLKEKHGVSV